MVLWTNVKTWWHKSVWPSLLGKEANSSQIKKKQEKMQDHCLISLNLVAVIAPATFLDRFQKLFLSHTMRELNIICIQGPKKNSTRASTSRLLSTSSWSAGKLHPFHMDKIRANLWEPPHGNREMCVSVLWTPNQPQIYIPSKSVTHLIKHCICQK